MGAGTLRYAPRSDETWIPNYNYNLNLNNLLLELNFNLDLNNLLLVLNNLNLNNPLLDLSNEPFCTGQLSICRFQKGMDLLCPHTHAKSVKYILVWSPFKNAYNQSQHCIQPYRHDDTLDRLYSLRKYTISWPIYFLVNPFWLDFLIIRIFTVGKHILLILQLYSLNINITIIHTDILYILLHMY